jgi:hypothetical protein
MFKFNNIFLCATCYTEKIQPTHDGIRGLAEKMENWGNVEPTPTKA